MKCIGDSFPNVKVHCKGNETVYTDIIWEDGDSIPSQADLDNAYLVNLKIELINSLSDSCQQDIVSGFTSTALGSINVYDSAEVDQLNLIGTTTATAPTPDYPSGASSPYAVRPMINGVIQPKVYLTHTYANFRKVLYDGSIFKLTRLQKFNNKRAYILNNVLTEAQVLAITWNSTE